ncbi:MAG: hypothetical protein RXR06_10825 [Thermoproteus sp.]
MPIESILTYGPVLAIGAAIGIAHGLFDWTKVRHVASGVLFLSSCWFIAWVASVGPLSWLAQYEVLAMIFSLGYAAGYILMALHMILVHMQALLTELKSLLAKKQS